MSEEDWKDHQRRANELGDAIRRYLLAINTGGIAVMFALAGSMLDSGVNPSWVIAPATLFALGVLCVGVSMFLARAREIDREKALKNKQDPPSHRGWMKSSPYHKASLFIFLVAVASGLYMLSEIRADNHMESVLNLNSEAVSDSNSNERIVHGIRCASSCGEIAVGHSLAERMGATRLEGCALLERDQARGCQAYVETLQR